MRSPFETSDLQLDAPGRGRVYNNVVETFGNTAAGPSRPLGRSPWGEGGRLGKTRVL